MYTRRAFLKTGGLAFFAAGFGGSPAFLNRAVHAALQPNQYGKRKILVTIFQRGGMDGLMAVPPMGDALLLQSRPRLGMSAARSAGENAVIDLKCGFGLHPGFASLLPYFKDNRLAIVHGMGSPDKTRSHFDAQDYMESGTPGRKGTRSGWLNRAVGQLGHEGTAFRAVAITKALPRSLYGDEPALAVSDLRHFGVKVPGAAKIAKKAGNTFESLYEATTEELLRGASRKSFEAIDLLSKAKLRSYRPQNGAEYPQGQLGNSLRQIALLVKADVGLEVAFAESGGWDTHVQQGTTNGSFARQSRELANAMTAFCKDIGKFQDNVVLMTMTEFGRTVRENGSGGTDHGRGSCLFVLGNSVDGGKVHGSVPRLVQEELEDGRDLPVTTDFRAIFAEVAGKHLGIQNDAALFPGWQGKRMHLLDI